MPVTLTITVPTPEEAAAGARANVSGPVDHPTLTMRVIGIALMEIAAYLERKEEQSLVIAKEVPKVNGHPALRRVE